MSVPGPRTQAERKTGLAASQGADSSRSSFGESLEDPEGPHAAEGLAPLTETLGPSGVELCGNVMRCHPPAGYGASGAGTCRDVPAGDTPGVCPRKAKFSVHRILPSSVAMALLPGSRRSQWPWQHGGTRVSWAMGGACARRLVPGGSALCVSAWLSNKVRGWSRLAGVRGWECSHCRGLEPLVCSRAGTVDRQAVELGRAASGNFL